MTRFVYSLGWDYHQNRHRLRHANPDNQNRGQDDGSVQKMGVELTAQAKTELAGAPRAQTVVAQTADTMGYTADKGGRTAEAAIYYTQAAAIDPSMLQTASRVSTLTASIANGSV